MTTMWQRTSLAMAGFALTLLAFGLPSYIRANEGGGDRPFKGSAVGSITGVTPKGAFVIESAGRATHLGNFTRTEYVFFGPAGAISGCLVFTAANGDELTADFSGGFISDHVATGTYTFTGRTGRFKDATGTAEFTATTPDLINVAISFDGSISY
jgi:hypothetical protein